MWASNNVDQKRRVSGVEEDDENATEDTPLGEPATGGDVRLYQPILHGRKPEPHDLLVSRLGGRYAIPKEILSASSFPVDEPHVVKGAKEEDANESAAVGPDCRENRVVLLQLHTPNFHPSSEQPQRTTYRTLIVDGCNSRSCMRQLFKPKCGGSKPSQASRFSFGGHGVIRCFSVTFVKDTPVVEEKTPTVSEWTQEDVAAPAAAASKTSSDDDDLWGDTNVDGNDESGLEGLEAQLAAMETSMVESGNSSKPTSKKPSAGPKSTKSAKDTSELPCYLLHTVREPPAPRPVDDDDDVGLSTDSNSKIQQMLSRYLAEEDDQQIQSLLRGTGGPGGGGEKDERRSEEDRAFMQYSDRIKRSPRQVVRYALGGVPLWSIPSPQQCPEIPKCPCGGKRVFEAQLLPSMLHVLDVDRFAKAKADEKSDASHLYQSGGLDFGNVAIYTCPHCSSVKENETMSVQEEYVVIQSPIEDDWEELMAMPPTGPRIIDWQDDVVIDENANFDDDTDAGSVMWEPDA